MVRIASSSQLGGMRSDTTHIHTHVHGHMHTCTHARTHTHRHTHSLTHVLCLWRWVQETSPAVLVSTIPGAFHTLLVENSTAVCECSICTVCTYEPVSTLRTIIGIVCLNVTHVRKLSELTASSELLMLCS